MLVSAGPAPASWATPPVSPPVSKLAASSSPLRDLIVDQLGTIVQGSDPAGSALGYDPEVHTYSATAYYHRTSVTLYPVTADGATVHVSQDGKTLTPDARGRYTVSLSTGPNTVTVDTASGDQKSSDTLTITKVDTDYRGNVLVTGVTAQSNRPSAPGHGPEAMLDADPSTSWTDAGQPVAAPDGAVTGTDGTGFTLTLPTTRLVSRLNLWGTTDPGTKWQPDEFATNAAISVSTDGSTWTTPVDKAPLRADQGILYWDLGGWYEARYVRVTLGAVSDGSLPKKPALTNWSVHTLEVWARPAGQTAPVSTVAGPSSSVAERCSDTATAAYGDIPRAQKLAICQGLTFPTWVASSGLGRGTPSAEENDLLGGLSPFFYDPPQADSALMSALPANTPWGIAKAPHAGNSIGDAGEPQEFLDESMKPYADNLADLQYGDEGAWSPEEVDSFAKWFAFSKQQYPQALAHSNQNGDPTWAANMSSYVQAAKPDLVSWDTYYWGGGGVTGTHGPLPEDTVASLLGYHTWQAQRQAAYEGLTGDGSQPILYGQYLDMFDFNGSQSQKALVTNLSLASGQKWLSFFRLEYNAFDGGAIVDLDGAPLRSAYEYGDIVTRAKSMARFLMPLNNQWVLTAPGQHVEDGTATTNDVATGWRLGSVADNADVSSQWGVTGVSAENIGTVNNGLPGDVVLGYFDALPGLSTDYARSVFGTSSPRAVMVTNGLTGYTEHGVNGEAPATMPQSTRYDDGQYWQTAQRITLEVTPGDRVLQSVDTSTGEVTTLPVTTRDGRSTVTLTLGGGQAALLLWGDSSPSTTPSPDATPSSQPSTVPGGQGTAGGSEPGSSTEATGHKAGSAARTGRSLAHTGADLSLSVLTLVGAFAVGGALLVRRRQRD